MRKSIDANLWPAALPGGGEGGVRKAALSRGWCSSAPMLGTWRLANVAIHGWTKRALAYVGGALLCMLVLLLADQWSKQWKPIPQGPQQPSAWGSFWQDGDCFFETGMWPWKTTANIPSEVCVEQPHYRTQAWYAHILNSDRQQPPPPLATAMEIGIDKGQTTETLARAFKEVHVFDFQERAEKIQRQIAAKGPDFGSVVTHVRQTHTLRSAASRLAPLKCSVLNVWPCVGQLTPNTR
jgi:hypothetical protein